MTEKEEMKRYRRILGFAKVFFTLGLVMMFILQASEVYETIQRGNSITIQEITFQFVCYFLILVIIIYTTKSYDNMMIYDLQEVIIKEYKLTTEGYSEVIRRKKYDLLKKNVGETFFFAKITSKGQIQIIARKKDGQQVNRYTKIIKLSKFEKQYKPQY